MSTAILLSSQRDDYCSLDLNLVAEVSFGRLAAVSSRATTVILLVLVIILLIAIEIEYLCCSLSLFY